MADRTEGALTPPGDPERSQGLLGEISTQMVRTMKEYFGTGPTQAKSYMMDDLLFVVMRGGVLKAEETLLQSGEEDTVRHFRQRFENEMTDRLTYLVEQLTGRKVINYQSQVMFDPHIAIEVFVFEQPADQRQREETARSIAEPEKRIGESRDEETPSSTEAEAPRFS
jgi:uncharacterized protein YbcI